MANFELADGEQIVFDYEVSAVENGKQLPGRLILTNQRLVLCAGNKLGLVGMMFGRFLQQTVAALTATRVTHEIARERFASVERGDGTLVVFRDIGEGYAHTSFAVTNQLLATRDGFEMLQRRVDTWAGR